MLIKIAEDSLSKNVSHDFICGLVQFLSMFKILTFFWNTLYKQIDQPRIKPMVFRLPAKYIEFNLHLI